MAGGRALGSTGGRMAGTVGLTRVLEVMDDEPIQTATSPATATWDEYVLTAFLWTSPVREAAGIHTHAFAQEGDAGPEIDETYPEVEIDGFRVDAVQVRTLMAQRSMPYLDGRVIGVACTGCGEPEFATGSAAHEPTVERTCRSCGGTHSARGPLREVVSNPMVECLARLATFAPRVPQVHDLGPIPETL